MHYTSFLNNLSSHLSIFPPLPPSVSASPFFCLALSASPLRYLSTWATSFPPPSLPPPFLSYPLYSFISSFPILPLYLSAQLPSSLCPLSPFPLRPPAWKLNPVGVGPARPRLPPSLSRTDPRKQTLNNKIKYIKTALGSPLRGQRIFLDTIFTFFTLFPALLHPVCLRLSPPPSLPLPPPDRRCRSLDSEASLQ